MSGIVLKSDVEQFSRYSQTLILSNGKLKEVPLRQSTTGMGFIDQITVSFHQSSILSIVASELKLNREEQKRVEENLILFLSQEIEYIFGFGITQKNDFKGRLFYQETYHLGDLNCQYGTVHIGGQNDTIAIEMTAEGCMAAHIGWEERLHDFLNRCIRPKITRVDIAHDFLNGEYTPDKAVEDFDSGRFSWNNRTPKSECRGTDWRSHDNSGKTFYIGSRYSSKYVRIYEKGKQLGDKSSLWTRFEIEFKSHDQVIPLDVLLHPSEYLCAAYPITLTLFEHSKSSRIQTIEKVKEITEERAIEFIKKQMGCYINYFKNIKCLTDEEFINLIKPKHLNLPKRLNPARFNCFESSNRLYQTA